nr:MAG TPA: hypothetical protein [Caudoviricetes sp.]
MTSTRRRSSLRSVTGRSPSAGRSSRTSLTSSTRISFVVRSPTGRMTAWSLPWMSGVGRSVSLSPRGSWRELRGPFLPGDGGAAAG